MSKQEKVVCAAIRTIGTDGKCERCLISVGVDYHFIQEQEGYENIHDIESILSEIRGFITNKNRFVDPAEALKITGWGNQLRFKDRKYLLPEDLY